MFSTTIIVIPRHFQEAMIFRNHFFMVKSIVVQPPLLARFAMATSGKPSTKFPLGELEGQEPLPLSFSRKFENFKKSHNFSTFWKSLAPIELWNFKVIFIFQYLLCKLQYILYNNYENSQALSESKHLQKLLLHGQEYRRAAAPSGPLSYCFGITFLLERNLLPFELLWQRAVNRQPSYRSGNS